MSKIYTNAAICGGCNTLVFSVLQKQKIIQDILGIF